MLQQVVVSVSSEALFTKEELIDFYFNNNGLGSPLYETNSKKIYVASNCNIKQLSLIEFERRKIKEKYIKNANKNYISF